MIYSAGNIGRVFIAKFDHEDDLSQEIESIIKNENIHFATILLIGALKSGKIVAGPENDKLPPRPDWKYFSHTHEILGAGTIVNTGDSVLSHIHITMGRGDKAFVGCLRGAAEVFLTVEAVITEIIGIEALREYNSEIKQKILKLK